MIRDLVLTEDDGRPGKLLVHRPGCPAVEDHRAAGRMVVTMLGTQAPIPPDLRRHDCVDTP